MSEARGIGWWVVMANGIVGEGWRTDAGKKGTPLRFVFSINFRKLRTIV